MTAKGFLIGGFAYLTVGLLYLVLAGGGRGGDMPFGYEIFAWPVLMFPIGIVGLVAPALAAKLGNYANDVFGTYKALDWFVIAGNLLLWALAGGFIGGALRKRRS